MAVKRVAGMYCTAESDKKEILQAYLERNMSMCLHNSFCRNREHKVHVDLLPCCKQRLLEHESWGVARNSVEMLQKVLEEIKEGEREDEAVEWELAKTKWRQKN